jgi:hypothetical protein
MRKSVFAITVAGMTTLGFGNPAVAQDNEDQKLGTVHFDTSCNETAQRRFDRHGLPTFFLVQCLERDL